MLFLPRHRRLVIVKSISSKSQIMVFPDWVRQRTTELKVCVIFLTRMPLPMPMTIVKGDVSRALWAAPVVGSVVGAVGAAVYWLMHLLHVPDFPAAALAVVATVAATGALHEDGLADVADGFGGGGTRERQLEIMRDSRIGTYGVFALVLSFMLRVGGPARHRGARGLPRFGGRPGGGVAGRVRFRRDGVDLPAADRRSDRRRAGRFGAAWRDGRASHRRRGAGISVRIESARTSRRRA